MPWVDLHSATDYASIYYTTNTFCYNVSAFDPEKPTIVLLHPVFLDSTWLDLQMGDPRLNKEYNMIAFDMRSCGQSTCRPSGQHDSWVDAADLAFCFQKLYLPPSHILALEGTSIYCALRFAALFPELCSSLTLVNVPAPIELKSIYEGIEDKINAACIVEDLESIEHEAFGCIEYLFGSELDPDLMDDLIAYWEIKLPPARRIRVKETTYLYINRAPLNPDIAATINKPVLVVQGEKNQLCPIKYAERLIAQLTGVPDGAVLYDVKGGKSMISVVPGPASILNNVFYKFLARLPRHRSDLCAPESSIEERMRMALGRLSELTGQSEMASLDPLCSLSFCCLKPEIISKQEKILRTCSKDIQEAYAPVGTVRKYSQREREEWSYSERATDLSLYGPANAPSKRVKQDFYPLTQTSTRSDAYSALSATDSTSPLLKTAFVATSAGDKRQGKGPMGPISKVVITTTTSTPVPLAYRPLA